MSENGLTLKQRVTICFVAGVIGALAVLLFSRVLFGVGLSAALGQRPRYFEGTGRIQAALLGGLWGILFGLFVKLAWKRLYLFGLLYVIVPLLALYLIFLPMGVRDFSVLRWAGRCSRSTCCW